MPRKTDTTPPWQDLEKQAYHAYREWPLWLMLRMRELDERLGKEKAKSRSPAACANWCSPCRGSPRQSKHLTWIQEDER